MHNGIFIPPKFSVFRRIHYFVDSPNKAILSLVQLGQYSEALSLYSRQTRSNSNTCRFIFPSLLKACTFLFDFRYGELLHSSVIKLGFHFDHYIVNSLVKFYIKAGSVRRAGELFDNESSVVLGWDIALWNSIIHGHFEVGSLEAGMAHFRQMMLLNVKPDAYTLCILLGMRNAFPDIMHGKEIHGFAMRNYCDLDPFVVTALIDMYCLSSRLVDAMNVFERSEKMCYIAVWNCMISGLCYNGSWIKATEIFIKAKRKCLTLVSASFASLLVACSQDEDVRIASQLHCDVFKMGFTNDPYVCTSLVTMYSDCGCLEDAGRILCIDENKKVEVWNATISAYVNHGCANDALGIYNSMRCRDIMPDSITYSTALIACSMMGSLSMGTAIHGELCKRLMKDSVRIETALQTMYSKLGNTKEARSVFYGMQEKDVIAWGSMIVGCLENLEFKEALISFLEMLNDNVKPDPNILASAFSSCYNLGYDLLGYSIHGLGIKIGLNLDACTGCALIEFYSRCGQPEMAMRSFSCVLCINIAVWNSLLSCYSENGMPNISLSLLPHILQDGVILDCITITIALSSVSQMALLPAGKAIHGYYIRLQFPQDLQVENSFLDMYIKCGFVTYALRIFSKMPKRDVVTWNSMISGHGFHGECLKAIDLFKEMKNSKVTPDAITFSSLISSCNHCGFIDEGTELFSAMKEHGVEPNMDHYTNMVDLLSRGGHLMEAFKFTDEMAKAASATISYSNSIWMSVLSASRVCKNAEIGEIAANCLIETNPSNYAQIANFYAEIGSKERAAELMVLMKQRGLKKLPGCSWIQIKDMVEVFFSGGFDARIGKSLEFLANCLKMSECTCDEELVD